MRIGDGPSSSSGGRLCTPEGISLERGDSIPEEGQVGAPVYWAISCDCEGRPGSLSFGFASRVGADSRHFPRVAIAEVYSR